MSRKIHITNILPSLALLATAITVPVSAVAAGQKIVVVNPGITSEMVERLPLSPRLDSIEGKTLYIVDNQWGGPQGAYVLFEEMEKWFHENQPTVKVVLRKTRDNMFGDDPALWKEIKEQGDAAIIGTGQ